MAEKQKVPNYQNFPKRGEGKEVRSIIVAPKDHLFVSIDYSALEGRVIAMASKDESFCNDIWNNIDPHMYWTERLVETFPSILLGKDESSEFEKEMKLAILKSDGEARKKRLKEIRQIVKSFWVFAAFYGSTWYSIYKNLEEEFGSINSYDVEALLNEFWDIYTGVKEWQRRILKFYEENRYVESLTGSRRRRAPLKYNEVLNMPIQSSSSYDICLRTGDSLSKMAYELDKPQFQYRIQVHDSLEFYIPESTIEEDVTLICKEMCRPVYSFINVPLEVEVSIGSSWADLEAITKYDTTMWWGYDKQKNSWKSKEN